MATGIERGQQRWLLRPPGLQHKHDMMATWSRPKKQPGCCAGYSGYLSTNMVVFVSAGNRFRTQRIRWLHGRPKTIRVLLLVKVLAEDDEYGFWDHWGRLKTKPVMLKL